MKVHSKRQNDQRGMASFMVTTVLILVIALIIIGFSQVARRNQRETLDRQLSTQAFYAAESGVNATVAAIKEKMASGGLPPNKTDCERTAEYPAEVKLDGTGDEANVEVTCILVTAAVDNLFYMGVVENSPTVVPLTSSNGPIAEVTLTWQNTDGDSSTTCTTNGFLAKSNWTCGLGVLRTDLSPTPNGNPDQVAMSTFFYPQHKGAASEATAPMTDYSSGGGLATGYCSDGTGNDPKCFAKITGLNADTYYMTLRSIYEPSTVTITAQTAGNTTVRFIGQALIDVTARAQDVTRRIQVRVPLEARTSTNLPAYGIESTGSLCKRFTVQPPSYYNPDLSTCN